MSKSEKQGYFFSIASAVLYGLMPLMVKKLYAHGFSAFSVTALKNWIALLPLLLLVLREGLKIPKRNQIAGIAAAGVLSNVATTLLLLSSYVFISSGTATTIHFVYPAMVLAGCALLYRQRLEPLQLVCVTMSIVGIVLFNIQDKGCIEGIAVEGIVLALLSGVTYAGYIIISGGKSAIGISAVSMAFYMTLVSGLVFALWNVLSNKLTLPKEPEAWLLLVMFAFINGVLTLLLFMRGVRLIGPQKTSILGTLEPMTSIVVGAIVLDEHFSAGAWFGCAAIVLSVIITGAKHRKA